MWRFVAGAYVEGLSVSNGLHEADEEIDILHDRLTADVLTGSMDRAAATGVTLLARFYERIGDHAVDLSRRIGPVARALNACRGLRRMPPVAAAIPWPG